MTTFTVAAPEGDDPIGRRTQGRVGGDARIAIGTATLQRHDEVGSMAGFALHVVDMRQHLADCGHHRDL